MWILKHLVSLLLAIPLVAQAQLRYSSDNGKITITRGCDDSPGAVVIPSAIDGLPVTTIGDGAYSGCASLTSVTFPNSITRIGEWAFEDCTRLVSVAIPNTVTKIGDGAFSHCASLKSIDVDVLNRAYSSRDGVLFDKNRTRLLQYPGGKPGNYTIPNTVTTIQDWVFSGCTGLTSVAIPNSVTTIGDGVFSDCTSLIGVIIPNSVTRIGRGAYSGCASLANVTIPNSVTTIEDWVFSGCASLTGVAIPKGVGTIGDGAFSRCASLKSIDVDALNRAYSSRDGVLFDKNRTRLLQYPGGKPGDYTIPNTVTTIGRVAFSGSASLTGVTIPNSVTKIGYGAFEDCIRLTGIAIPNSVTTIESWVFSHCASLKSIDVDALNPAYSSRDGVLFDKNRTTLLRYPGGKPGNYTIPNSVTTVESWAFYSCSSLTGITIPNSATTIGDGAFSDCASLNVVTIPSSVATIGRVALSGCANLKSIDVDALNPAYSSQDGVLFDKNRTTLLRYPCGKPGSYVIPNKVTTIGDGAFSDCAGLSGVAIPNSVATIKSWAFSECASLTSVYFQGSAPTPDDDLAFSGSEGVTVYYLANTSGWGTSYASRRTALWSSPLILSNGPGFGVGADGFGFLISWAPNAPVVVEAATNLDRPVWFPLRTNAPPSGTFQFSDSRWADYPTRFYRVRTP